MDTVRTTARGELVMPFAVFKAADYGQLCQRLGLRPSKPSATAEQLAERKPVER
jgi:hypothetical protein